MRIKNPAYDSESIHYHNHNLHAEKDTIHLTKREKEILKLPVISIRKLQHNIFAAKFTRFPCK
jgi:hypothetical protein